MDIRVAEGVYAEKIVHYHNKAIGGVSKPGCSSGRRADGSAPPSLMRKHSGVRGSVRLARQAGYWP